jgi:transcriptional regulator with XRE-family HTH domain
MDESRMVGIRLNVARSFSNITQSKLAESMGVSQTNVAAWEAGTRDIPCRHIPKLCKALGTTPDFLFGFVEDYDPLTQRLHKHVSSQDVYQRITQLTNLVLAWKRRALKAERHFQMANDALVLSKMERVAEHA